MLDANAFLEQHYKKKLDGIIWQTIVYSFAFHQKMFSLSIVNQKTLREIYYVESGLLIDRVVYLQLMSSKVNLLIELLLIVSIILYSNMLFG